MSSSRLCCRYFQCRPLHGIFARTNKVAKISGGHQAQSAPPVASTPLRRPSAGAGAARMGALTSAHRERSGSQDSVSSVGSSVSTSSRSRVRLGVTSLNEQKMASSSGYGQKQVFYLVSKRRRHFEFFSDIYIFFCLSSIITSTPSLALCIVCSQLTFYMCC